MLVRGIKHTNNLHDAECRPTAEIINGGINYQTATVRVTAPRGCGIDSEVEFYIDPAYYNSNY